MIKRTVSLLLSLALLVNGVQPIHAADLVAIPQNVHLPTPPTYIQTRSSELSFKSIETKINNVLKPEKTQPKVAATYPGYCGTNVKWNLDTSTGILTISGSGAMKDYTYSSDTPWYSYRSSIKTLVIKNGVTSIGNDAFYDCSRLTSVTIPKSVTSIGDFAFYDCSGLTSVTIPGSVTTIGIYAFSGCTGLTSVTIPDSVTSIDYYAFRGCTGLTSVTIPDSVTFIGSTAFQDCSGLTSINVDINNSNYTSINGVLFNKDGTSLISYPNGKSGSYTIPSSVTTIGGFAFYGCTRLTSVTFPDSVTTIGSVAFFGCTGLTSVTYKGTSDPGASSVFNGCNNLHCVLVPSDYTSNTFCGIPVTKGSYPTPSHNPTSAFKPSLFKLRKLFLKKHLGY